MHVILFFLLLIAAMCVFVKAYSIDLEAGGKECFVLPAEEGETISGSYEILDHDPGPMEVYVKGPSGKVPPFRSMFSMILS